MTCVECGMKIEQCVCEYDPLLEDEEASDFINLSEVLTNQAEKKKQHGQDTD